MTPAQIAEAQKLAREWQPKRSQDTTAARAAREQRLHRHGHRAITSMQMRGGLGEHRGTGRDGLRQGPHHAIASASSLWGMESTLAM